MLPDSAHNPRNIQSSLDVHVKPIPECADFVQVDNYCKVTLPKIELSGCPVGHGSTLNQNFGDIFSESN